MVQFQARKLANCHTHVSCLSPHYWLSNNGANEKDLERKIIIMIWEEKLTFNSTFSKNVFPRRILSHLGGIHEWGGSVSPLVSSVSVLLAHLHAAQTRPVCPGSPLQLPSSLPAAPPRLALVRCQHLCLPTSDVSPRSPVFASHGSGGWGCGHFDPGKAQNGWQWHHQWESVVPAEDSGDASHQNQTGDVWSQSYATRLSSAVNWYYFVFL